MVSRKNYPLLFDWLDSPSKILKAFFGAIVATFGIGFAAGDYKKDVESKLELIKSQSECNRQIEAEKANCAEVRQKLQSQKVEELSRVVEELRKQKGGKNEK